MKKVNIEVTVTFVLHMDEASDLEEVLEDLYCEFDGVEAGIVDVDVKDWKVVDSR